MKFNHAVVAGTFDHLHQGHQQLLKSALYSSRRLSIGLTQTALVKTKPLSKLIQSPAIRLSQLNKTLTQSADCLSIFPLTDPFEPAASTNRFDGIIASTQTAPAVKKLNNFRIKNHLKPLPSVIINLVKSSDNKTLSSTRIRRGETNRAGFAYHQLFPKTNKLSLPPLNRHFFTPPFGHLLTGSHHHLSWSGLKAKIILKNNPPFLTVAVGDIAAISLLRQKISLNLAVIDLKTRRRQLFNNLSELNLNHHSVSYAINPSATITPNLVSSLQTGFQHYLKPQSILVKGEEDLAVLPVILLSPLNTAVFYGQPDQGLVYIRVTESSKQKAVNLLKKFI